METMRLRLCRVPLLMIVVLGFAACAPAPPRSMSTDPETRQAVAAADQSRLLRIVVITEPSIDTLVGGGGSSKTLVVRRMFLAGLSARDSHDVSHPVLAESLPRLNSDTWKVFPDGRMETMYRLRPGLTWHDGSPLTAADFVFSLRAIRAAAAWGAPALGIADDRKAATFMDEIVAPDAQSVLIRWPGPYPGSGALPFPPLPRHLLESSLDQDSPDVYQALDYWSNAYVGVGPYRLARWERGAYIEGTAFEGYALGRPKIDRILVTFSDKPTVTVVRLLADDVDMAANGAISFQEAGTLKPDWVPRTQGCILLSPIEVMTVQFQQRPEYAAPRALLDVRTRQALLHAIDRPALAETMVDDRTMAAETMVPASVGFYAAVDRAITKYPFDMRRTEQLMAEVGFSKGADGIFVHPVTGRFSTRLLGGSGGSDEQEATIVSDYLKRGGVETALDLIPPSARASSDELHNTFPGMNVRSNPITPPMLGLDKFTTPYIGAPHNNWKGINTIGFSHPEADRAVEGFKSSLDPKEGEGLIVQMLVVLSNALPVLPLYFNFSVDAFTGSLRGPEVAASYESRYTNIHLWEWQ